MRSPVHGSQEGTMRQHITGWFRPSASPRRLTVRSQAYELETHFVQGLGSCRCQGAACELCSQQGEPKRTLVFIVDYAGQLMLLEINAAEMARTPTIGDELVVSRRKLGDFTETYLRVDGHSSAVEVTAPNYLAALGQRSYERYMSRDVSSP